MRDIALTLFFLAVLPFALRHTWVGVLLWTWLSIMNPHRLTYGFAYSFPFALITAIVVVISIPRDKHQLKFPNDAAYVILVFYMLWMCITTIFAFQPADSSQMLVRVLKIDFMTLVAAAAIRSRRQIELFCWVNALSVGFFGVKGGVFTILTGGGQHVWGPEGSFIQGNNELGLALVMTIPLLNYLRLVSSRPWVRRGLLAAMLLSAAAALGTQSRGAFLAISAMVLVLWTRSQSKVLSGVTIALLVTMALAFLPASWDARMHTINTYQEDASAMGRINAWWTAFHLANDRFLGGGYSIYDPTVFARYAPDPTDVHAAHSIYFQALGEHGYVGLALFLAIGACGFLSASQVRRQTKEREDSQWAYHLAGMIQVSMVGYAVGGAFLSLDYFDLPYNVLVMIVATKYWLKEKRWETELTGAFSSTAPQGRLPVPAKTIGAR